MPPFGALAKRRWPHASAHGMHNPVLRPNLAASLWMAWLPNRRRRPAFPVGVSRDARNIPSRNSAAIVSLWGFGQKAVAARTRARGAQPCFAAKRCRNCVWVCLPMNRQQPFTGYPAANRNACGIHGGRNPLPAKRTAGILRFAAKTGFFPQKTLLPRLCSRGKRNSPSAISTPRLKLSKISRLAGLRLWRPIAARYLWDILSGVYLA